MRLLISLRRLVPLLTVHTDGCDRESSRERQERDSEEEPHDSHPVINIGEQSRSPDLHVADEANFALVEFALGNFLPT